MAPVVALLPSSMLALNRLAAAAVGTGGWSRWGGVGSSALLCSARRSTAAPAGPSAPAARELHSSGSSSSSADATAHSSSSGTSTTGSSGGSPAGRAQQAGRAPAPARGEAALLSEDGAAVLCVAKSDDVAGAAARAPSLRLLQRHFSVSAPGLRGQAVLARVVRGGAGAVVVDPGYYGLSAVATRDLGMPQLFTASGAPVPPRGGGRPRLVKGGYLRLRLAAPFTPYGDVQLEPLRVARDVRRKLVWKELARCMKSGEPVRGRVLNPCQGGYAVGVAGYVALLPSKQANMDNMQRIGSEQQFYIHRMEEKNRYVELSNFADAAAGGGGGGGASLQGGAPAAIWSNIGPAAH